MKQAVNTFQGGLQTDLDPMIQGKDVLSDALNATIITMDGNEGILQNDMGNRRIDNAYLPEGYEPVGIKEYGGVIYLALYNPLTDKGQIGSFPSPERKINPIENPLTNTIPPLPTTDIKLNDITFTKLKFIQDKILFPISNKNLIHAGDKFDIYYDIPNGSSYDIEDFSNRNNVNGSKIISPKNKLFTLSLGVLNSQNEFVDITPSLKRWYYDENDDIIELSRTGWDLYDYNNGYFLKKSNSTTEDDPFKDIDDSNLDSKRLKTATNTYAYKLVGPLYGQIELNHIQDFNYNIYGYKEKNNNDSSYTVTIQIESIITYNCPDNFTKFEDITPDDIYESYEIPKTTFDQNNIIDKDYNFGYDFVIEGLQYGDSNNEAYINSNVNDDTLKNYTVKSQTFSYDKNTNLYKAIIVREYKFKWEGEDSPQKRYKMLVKACSKPYTVGASNNYYIENLSSEGTLDLNLLGSGEINISSWRFYNNVEERTTTIVYDLEQYLKFGNKIDYIQFNFYDVNLSSIIGLEQFKNYQTRKDRLTSTFYVKEPLTQYTGRNTVTFNWPEGCTSRHLYAVNIEYSKDGEQKLVPENQIQSNNLDLTKVIGVPFFLSTELFNDKFLDRVDFRSLNQKQVVSPSIKLNIKDYSQNQSQKIIKKSGEPADNSLIFNSQETAQKNLIYERVKNVKLRILAEASYKEELYPSYLTYNTDLIIGENCRLNFKDNQDSLAIETIDGIKVIDFEGFNITSQAQGNAPIKDVEAIEKDIEDGIFVINIDTIKRDDLVPEIENFIESKDVDFVTDEHPTEYSNLKYVNFNIISRDIIAWNQLSTAIPATNVFTSINDYIGNSQISNSAVVVEYKEDGNKRSIYFVKDYDNSYFSQYNAEAVSDNKKVAIKTDSTSSYLVKWQYSNYASDIQSNFQNLNNSDAIFACINTRYDTSDNEYRYMQLESQPKNSSDSHPDANDGLLSMDNARVWWKTENGNWALIDGAFRSHPSPTDTSPNNKDIEFFKNLLPGDVYFCSIFESNGRYIPLSPDVSNPYSKIYTLYITPEVDLGPSGGGNISIEDNSIDYPVHFVNRNVEGENNSITLFGDKYEYQINSSEDFHLMVSDTLSKTSFSEITSDNILRDENGNKLKVNSLYKKYIDSEGHTKLRIWHNKYLRPINYQLLCVPNKYGITSYPIEFAGGSGRDKWVTLDYDTVEAIDKNLLKYES